MLPRASPREYRGLDLHEAPPVQVGAGEGVHAAADAQIALHPLPAQVQVSIGQAQVLVHLIGPLPHLEGQRRGGGEQQKVLGHDLHGAGLQSGVLRPLGAGAERALDGDAVLVPKLPGPLVDLPGLGAEYDLDGPGVVPQLDEDDAN